MEWICIKGILDLVEVFMILFYNVSIDYTIRVFNIVHIANLDSPKFPPASLDCF